MVISVSGDQSIAETIRVLADPTRAVIIEALAAGPAHRRGHRRVRPGPRLHRGVSGCRKWRRGRSAGRGVGHGLHRPAARRLDRPGSARGSALGWTGGIAGKRARPGRDLGPRAAARIAVGLRSSGGHRTPRSGGCAGHRSPVGATPRNGSNVSARRAVRAPASLGRIWQRNHSRVAPLIG